MEKKRLSLQVGNRIICMWATSAPRGPPFSVLKGESVQTMAVCRWQKSQFPCMHWYNALELVVQCCLDSATVSFNTAAIVPDPLFLYSFLSVWIWVCSIGLAPTIHPHRRTKMRHGSGHLFTVKSTHYSESINLIYAWNAPRRIIITHVSYGNYASIHPVGPSDIHQCAQWTGKWQIKRPHQRPLKWTQGHL